MVPSKKCGVPTENELSALLLRLSSCKAKPAVLSLVPEHASRYVPSQLRSSFPKPLLELYQPKFLQYDYSQLLEEAQTISFVVTDDNISSVEQATKGQSTSKIWFKYRSGRITASKMKRVCRTNHCSPSHWLIKEICYPELFQFTTVATEWGIRHEKEARNMYKETMVREHDGFSVAESGLILNSDWPFLGATPDGTVNCSCCGKGVIEIKCPYNRREDSIEGVAPDSRSCLKVSANGTQLDTDHEYYYQVQTQIHVCKVDYGDFCVCTFPSNSTPQIHVERISPDPVFWEACLSTATMFFDCCLLPQLLGRWYTRGVNVRKAADSRSEAKDSMDNPNPLYCYCQEPEDFVREMIGCDNPECKVQWFHTECLHIDTIPDGHWYCPDCSKINCSTITKNTM